MLFDEGNGNFYFGKKKPNRKQVSCPSVFLKIYYMRESLRLVLFGPKS